MSRDAVTTESKTPHQSALTPPPRRGVLGVILMAVGLIAGYGLGAWHFFQYLIPLKAGRRRREMFVGTLDTIPVGSSLTVRDPAGQEIAVARAADVPDDPAKGFKALSSKCPHLGCKVHWVSSEQHFFCPCHEGVFSKEGIALSGPPAKENKNLSTYEVRVDRTNGWVYVMVSAEQRYGV